MKLNYKRTFFIGLAFLSISAFWQLYDNLIPLMLSNTFSLSETKTGMIMAADNVLALFLLPLFGSISDKTETKIGKRKPFILTGTLITVIAMVFIPHANNLVNFPMFITALTIVLLSMSTYRAPTVALMPDLTPKPLRSKANAVINLMGAVGGTFSLLAIFYLVPKTDNPNYMMVFVSIALVMFFSVLLMSLTIDENKIKAEVHIEKGDEDLVDTKGHMPKDVKRSLYFILASIFLWFTAYNAVTTAFSRYAIKVWGLTGGGFAKAILVATIAAIISFIPVGFLSTKLGRKKTVLMGITLVTLSYLAGVFFKEYSPFINLVFGVMGIGWAMINVNSYPMVVEMSKSGDIGKYTGLYYTFSMAAQIFTPVFSGFLLENIGYQILFPYALIFSIASFITMSMVKHGDSKPEKKDKLESFDVEV